MNITPQEFPYNYKIIFILGIECSISKVNSLLVQEEMECGDVIDSKFSIQGFTIVTNQLVRVEAVQ